MPIKGKKALIARIRQRSDQLVRAIALEMLGRLIRRTPVDTGRARANWNVALSQINRDIDAGRSRKDVESNKAAGMSVIARMKAGNILYLTNSLPYIPRLEEGSSKQAPSGMAKITAAEMKPLAQRIAAKIAAGDL